MTFTRLHLTLGQSRIGWYSGELKKYRKIRQRINPSKGDGDFIKTLFGTLRKNKIPFVGFFLFYIAASLVISAGYVASQIVVGEMGQAAYQFDTRGILNFLIILTAIMAVRAVFSALTALFIGRFAGKAEYSFRINFTKFFLRQPFAKFEKVTSGESLSVFTNDLPQAVSFVSSGTLGIVSDFILLIVAIVYMFYISWLYTLIFVAIFPVLVFMQVLISLPIQKAAKKALEAQSGFNAVVNDSLQNTATVIAYSLEEELENRYASAYRKYYLESMRLNLMDATLVGAGFAFSALPLVFLFIAAGFAVLNETMLISEFVVYTSIGIMAAAWLMELAESLSEVEVWIAGAKRFGEYTTGDEENIGEMKSLTVSGKTAARFENISFAYGEDAPDVLKNVSFEIQQGEKVAIVGDSGVGKSTILKLLLGLYEPKSGKISVLGNDTATIGKYTLRDSIAYVPQDSFLFPVSISENITGKNEISPEEQIKLETACSDAGIMDFIKSLPEEFNSVLSESAENISGGQRQRIAMARAFYKDAPIILFDEATSSLDHTTEAEILRTLTANTKGKTVVMVAHRTAVKEFCDIQISLEGGKIV